MRTGRERLGLRYCSHNHIGSRYWNSLRNHSRRRPEVPGKLKGSVWDSANIGNTDRKLWGTSQERFCVSVIALMPYKKRISVTEAHRKLWFFLWIYNKKWEQLIPLSESRKAHEKAKKHDNATQKQSAQWFRLPLRLIADLLVASCPWHDHQLLCGCMSDLVIALGWVLTLDVALTGGCCNQMHPFSMSFCWLHACIGKWWETCTDVQDTCVQHACG